MFPARSSCYHSRSRCSGFGRFCLSAVLTLLLCAGGRGQSTQPSPNPTRQRAEAQVKLTSARLARDKDLAAAGEGFLKAHQLDATYPLPLLYLGGIAQKQEHWDAAIGYFENFCKLDDKSDLYVDTQLRLDQVRKFAEQDKTPQGKRTRQYDMALAHAKTQVAAGKLDEAAEASKQLIASDPQRWEGHALYGDLLMRRRAYQDALTPLSQSLTLIPADKRPAIEEAIKQCTRETNAAKAAELVKAGDHAAAAKVYADLYQTSPDKEQYGMSAALAYGVAGKFAESAELLHRLERSKEPTIAHQATEKLAALTPLLEHQSPQIAKIAPKWKVGDTWINSAGIKFAYVPTGEFDMGSPVTEADHFDNETLHHVKITKPFLMATTAVTQAQWKAVMGSNPSHFQGDDRPVETVSWNDAVTFCTQLSAKEGRRYRLPTEAEWEYACRAGTQGVYGGAGSLDEMGWYSGNSNNETHPVAQKRPNAWGLCDMHGNVLQWCSDAFGAYAGDAVDPKGASDTSSRVLRGGSWNVSPSSCRAADRGRVAPFFRYNFIGFRVCLDF